MLASARPTHVTRVVLVISFLNWGIELRMRATPNRVARREKPSVSRYRGALPPPLAVV
jgi:hypothetical protein